MMELVRHRHCLQIGQATKSALLPQINTQNAVTPPGWIETRLRRCLSRATYGIGAPTKPTGSVAVLGMGNVNDSGAVTGSPAGYVDEVESDLLLRDGDLLFNRTNSLAKVGKVGLVRGLDSPTTFASYLVRLRTSELAAPEYLIYLLNTDPMLGLARSTALPSIGQANLNPSRYGELRILIPSVALQRVIVRELDEKRREAGAVVGALKRQIGLLVERRQALITAAVMGEVAPSGAV